VVVLIFDIDGTLVESTDLDTELYVSAPDRALRLARRSGRGDSARRPNAIAGR
jgi:beta-phosphoglucomutase-like phosphatase (HAD superfamily)